MPAALSLVWVSRIDPAVNTVGAVNSLRKLGIGAVVTGLVLSTVTTATAERPAAAAPLTGDHQTLTLVTGDRVTLVDGVTRAVTPAAGREDMSFSTHTAHGHTYVFPDDVRGLLGSGRVDRRLFDVTTLLEYGYRDGTPLIVTGDALPMAARSGRDLPAVNGVAVTTDPAGALWKELTTSRSAPKIWLDGKRKTALDRSTAQIGAPAAWEAGYTGAGVTVAVLDTGVDQNHPDLADREIAEQNFSAAPDNVDRVGHGTHVASTVAGTGATYRGVANGAAILDGKVLDDEGYGLDSWIIAGMQWATEQGADIVNLSLGGSDLPGIDPVEEAVNTLSAQHGTLFVISAGNAGAPETIGSPGSAAAALTVGAVDRDDQLAYFSSQGPTPGDGGLKPDLTAPGVDIVAAEAGGSGHVANSGTSMATPHIAGAAALLAQQHPDWTGAQLKAALTGSATANPGLGEYAQGAGRVDVARAINQTVVGEPGSIDFGTQAWPHDDDQPITKPLTYHNSSTTDVTLALSIDATDTFTLGTNEITVPAGGTAQVSVTADTRVGTAEGPLSATVVATAGENSVRTPVGVMREYETHTLTINYLDENGEPAPDNRSFVAGYTNDYWEYHSDEDGTVELNLREGRYFLDHDVFVTGENEHTYSIAQPSLELTADTTVTADARTTKPIDVTPPAGATPLLGDIGYAVRTPAGEVYRGEQVVNDPAKVSTAHLGPPVPAGDTLTARVNTQWAGPDGSFYGLAWFQPDTMFTGFTKVVDQSELATVHVDTEAQGAGPTAQRLRYADPVDGNADGWASQQTFPLPDRRTEYLTAEGQVWGSETVQLTGEDTDVTYISGKRAFRAGQTYAERVGNGMFGPALPDTSATDWAIRHGELLVIGVPLFGDASGNGGFAYYTTSAGVKVFSDGELIGESAGDYIGAIPVPAEERDYRVTVTATRGAPFDLATTVSAEWTFSSAYAPPADPAPLDVSVLRYHPKLDGDNAAPAGQRFLVPVALQRNGGATERPRDLTVEASYDEGKTWQRTPVLLNTVAVLDHPANAETVSLRASGSDRAGNTVRQTIIRAYHLK